ncbi:MAG: hypothetical protein ABI780_07350 [Ardenticatenales bacterium]
MARSTVVAALLAVALLVGGVGHGDGDGFGHGVASAHPLHGGPVDSAVGATAVDGAAGDPTAGATDGPTGRDLSAYALVTMLALALIGFARGVKREARTLLVTGVTVLVLGYSWPKVAAVVNKQWKMFNFGVIKRGVMADDPSVVWKSLSDLKPLVPASGGSVNAWQIGFFAMAVLLFGYGVLRIPRPPKPGGTHILPTFIDRLVGALLGSLTGLLVARFVLPRIVPGARISIVDPRLSIASAAAPYAPYIFFGIVVLLLFFGVKGLGGGGPRQKVYN